MELVTQNALVTRLKRYDVLVEVGVGRRPGVAAALATAGKRVTATDVHLRDVPAGVSFVCDDITAPDPSVYRDADALYACNLPPELHRPALAVARRHDAAFAFTTLGAEFPDVAATPETIPGETLYWARR